MQLKYVFWFVRRIEVAFMNRTVGVLKAVWHFCRRAMKRWPALPRQEGRLPCWRKPQAPKQEATAVLLQDTRLPGSMCTVLGCGWSRLHGLAHRCGGRRRGRLCRLSCRPCHACLFQLHEATCCHGRRCSPRPHSRPADQCRLYLSLQRSGQRR